MMDKVYDHKKYEKEIYRKWEHSGAFGGDLVRKPYTILMPPPNANASLHAGHAMYTIDDIMARWKRMQGYSVEWIPGMDHAGFETQFVYEKRLAKEGKSRMDFDRQSLYNNIFQFVKDNSGLIYEQFKRLGFSADWERSVFTLDNHVLKRVFATFKQMEEEGKVYRDEYIVNYCTNCGTSLAELEAEHEERVDPLFYIKYGPFVLATTRPETKFGDTGVAVHPKDKRYAKYVGQEIEVEGLLGKFKVSVIADEEVDPEFGTGVVKVTPAHDPNDFEMGKRHGLEIKQVIGSDGRLNERTGKYKGLKVAEARKVVAEEMQKMGLIVKIDENYKHVVSLCYRCKRVLEPMVVPNWFINVAELKKPVIAAVKADKVKFYPRRFKKQMLSWLETMHDWPISRQIVWGIRIPVWYSIVENPQLEVVFIDKEGEVKKGKARDFDFEEVEQGLQKVISPIDSKFVVSEEKPAGEFLPETDTFDTWFSSGQWPLVTLKEDEYETRFPTHFMGTLSDILKFWISRMIMFSLYIKNEVPFKEVYLWSMVADAKGQKMSKSKGNVINPIELVDKYGADALRMTLVYGVPGGGQVNLAEDKVRGMRNFSNKLWNVARFVEAVSKEVPNNQGTSFKKDLWIVKELNILIKKVTIEMDGFKLNLAAEQIYDFVWHRFADKYIEEIKDNKAEHFPTLRHVLITCLKLLHPFIPFVTEAIWDEIAMMRKKPEEMLMVSSWPEV